MMIIRVLEIGTAFVAMVYVVLAIVGLVRRWRSAGRWVSLALLLVVLPTPARADIEAKAVALGSAAKCAQSWNASSVVADGGNNFGYHQSVTPDKPCLFDANVEMLHPHDSGTTPVAGTAGTYPAVFSALPASHTNTYVLVFPEGYAGQTETGWTGGAQIRTQGRWAYRWYIYYSSNYSSYAFPAGPCTNSSKWASIQPSFIQMTHQSNLTIPQVYGWAAPPETLIWLPDVSPCCWFGPGYDFAAQADGALPGSWWRYEMIGHGMDGTPGAYLKVYRKNITINGPDRKIVDTTIDCLGCDGGTWDWPEAAKTSLQSPPDMYMVTSNFYRAGTCSGYIATAYALFAQWDTDSGQRIEGAVEMEGDGESPPPSTPQSSSRLIVFAELAPLVLGALWHVRRAILAGSLAIGMFVGAVWTVSCQKSKAVGYNATVSTVRGVALMLESVKQRMR